MKLFLSSLIVIFSFSVMAAEDREKCHDDSQSGLNKCALQNVNKAESELNQTVKKIQEMYADDPVFLDKLKESQKQWIKFRHAEFAMMYPPNRDISGSVTPMCEQLYLEKLINDRIATLKQWLKGVDNDGDVCGSGSIKYLEEIWDIEDTQEIKNKQR